MKESSIRTGFHWKDDWFFSREPDDSVVIKHYRQGTDWCDVFLSIPVNEWESILIEIEALLDEKEAKR